MPQWRISARGASAALLALVALDIVLVGTALQSTRATDIDTSPLSRASITSDSAESLVSPSASPSPSSSRSPSTSRTAAKVPLQTMLVALDDRRAWRVAAGSCSAGGAALAVTVDGGRTWTKGTVTLRRIVRLRAEGTQVAFAVGANSTCAAEIRDTVNGGGTWTSTGDVKSAWFRDPKNPRVVKAPGPVASQPCGKRAVLDLAVVATTSARALCADGLVRSTANNGGAWTDVGTVDGAVALAVPAARPAETYVARLGAPDCAGVQILRVRPQATTSCVIRAIPKGPGQIAMSLINGGGWLAVGDTTMRSTDDLVTWAAS
ncbi:MAG TPA: hypothetical protein VF391_02930 [Dermatophilaceae bacterium]